MPNAVPSLATLTFQLWICWYSCDPQLKLVYNHAVPSMLIMPLSTLIFNIDILHLFKSLSFNSIASVRMNFCITTLLLAAISIRLRFTLAFPFSSYFQGRRTLNTLLPVNETSESIPQNTVIPSTNLTSTNVTFIPWPVFPYYVSLPSENYTLGLTFASQWISWPPIDLVDLMDFISVFGENLEAEYPPPAFAPRRAGSKDIDGKTFTRWTITYERSVLGKAVPTEVVLECLEKLNSLLRRHGPSTISSVIFSGRPRLLWSAAIFMDIENLDSNTLNFSSPSGGYDFETS